MSLEQNKQKIDSEQDRIKSSLEEADNVEGEEKLSEKELSALTQTFITDVDEFQTDIAAKIESPDIQAALSQEILAFLEGAIGLTEMKELREELQLALSNLDENLEKQASWEKGKYQIRRGDTLSKIATRELGLGHWKDDPVKVFSAVKLLHDSRSKTLPTLNSNGELNIDPVSSGPDALSAGEWINLSVLDDLKSTSAGSMDDVQWYVKKSPVFGRMVEKAALAKEGKADLDREKRSSTDLAVDEIDAALASAGRGVETDTDVSRRAEALLDREEQLMFQEAQNSIEVEVVRTWLTGLNEENRAFASQVNDIREEMTGWSGYGHSIELHNWVASAGNLLGGDFETEQSLDLKLSEEYLSMRRSVETGIAMLLGEMRGGERRGHGPLTLKAAWDKLDSSGNADFHSFKTSPEGHLFAKTALVGKEPTAADNAQHLLERAREIKTRLGQKHAEPYYMAILEQYPSTSQASSASKEKMTSGEKAADMGMEVFKVMTRLDSLAIMVATLGVGAGVNAAFKGSAAGVRIASLATKYPRLAKLVPGVQAVRAAEGASVLSRLGIGTFNLTVELGKFVAYESIATKVGGPKAGYAVGMLCFLTPGLVHGFERVGAATLEHAIRTEGPAALERFGAYAAEQAGGKAVLREAMVKGVERQALAAGETVERAVIEATVDDALRAIGIVEAGSAAAGRTAASKGSALALRESTSVALAEAKGGIRRLEPAFKEMEEAWFREGVAEAGGMSSSTFEKIMGFLKMDVGESFKAAISKFKPSTRQSAQRFKDTWTGFQQFMREDWHATKTISRQSLDDLAQAARELTAIFRSLPTNAKHLFTTPLARLRNFLARASEAAKRAKPTQSASAAEGSASRSSRESARVAVRDTASRSSRDSARVAGEKASSTSSKESAKVAGEKASSTSSKESAKVAGEKAASGAESAADRFKKFVEKLRSLRDLSVERAEQIATADKQGAERIRTMYSENLKHFRSVLEGLRSGNVTAEQFKISSYSFSQMVTTENNGALRKALRSASTLDEQIAVMETVIANAEKQVTAAEARLAILAQTEKDIFEGLGSKILKNELDGLETVTAEQLAERYKLLKCFGSRSGSADDILIKEKMATSEGRKEVATLIQELLGVSETATKGECKKAWRKLLLQIHPDRLVKSSVTPEQEIVLKEIRSILSNVKGAINDPKTFNLLFRAAA